MQYRKLTIPAALGLAGLLPAQDVVKDINVEFEQHAGVAGSLAVAPQSAATFQFIAAEPGLLGKVVTGAPYSGEGFTEMVQTLADGTRITNKHSKKMWRDGKGRTREEATLTMLGPWAAQGGAATKLITIIDPVSKTIYTLNEKDKTAIRNKMPDLEGMMAKMTAEAKADGKGVTTYRAREQRETVVHGEVGGVAAREDVLMAAPPGVGAGHAGVAFTRAIRIGDGGGKEEALGTQVLEGLKVEGKRQTHTIKAGEVGNDRELVSVTERWNSTELQVLVRMTSKDPQMGETTYRLTNIARTEPAATLFQLPSDYTVTDAIEHIRFDRKIEPK
jgi:hypothetical protein